MDDIQIINLFFGRDEAAIRETSRKYGSRLRQISYGIVQNSETAEECVNDTYYEAWKAIPPHCPKDYFFAFLAKITRNLSINRCMELTRLKRKAFICELSNEMAQCIPGNESVEQHMERTALEKEINRFLMELDPQKRNIFIRRYWYLDSVQSIAERFGISQSNVKTTLSRCRKKLRSHLEKEDIFL